MAIDTTKLGTIYSTLNNITKTTLDDQWNSKRLRGEDYASVVSQTITALIQTSASLIESEANRAEEKRQFDAKLLEDAPIRNAQANLIEKQIVTEEKKALLTVRQTTAYDDKLRIAKSDALNQKEGMYAAGGTAIPAELTTVSLNAANAIVP